MCIILPILHLHYVCSVYVRIILQVFGIIHVVIMSVSFYKDPLRTWFNSELVIDDWLITSIFVDYDYIVARP